MNVNNNNYNHQKLSGDTRPFTKLHSKHFERAVACPQRAAWTLNNRGSTTRKSFLRDVQTFMNTIVSMMCLVTYKIGVVRDNGFYLYTWKAIADKSGLEEYRVKQCFEFAKRKNWMTSKQPKKQNAYGSWEFHASMKRVERKYFEDLGLIQYLEEARKSALEYVKVRAIVRKKPIAYFLVPITLLKEIRQKLTVSWQKYFNDHYRFDNPHDNPI